MLEFFDVIMTNQSVSSFKTMNRVHSLTKLPKSAQVGANSYIVAKHGVIALTRSLGVRENMTHCELMRLSQSGKTVLLGYVQKAEMHSLPIMPIIGRSGSKREFSPKKCQKTAFLRDTNRDHMTLEGHNSLNFKDFCLSQGCFGKFVT